MKKKFRNLNKPTTLRDLDDLAAHIITAVGKETTRIEEKVDKVDLKLNALDHKVSSLDQKVTSLDKKVDKLDYDVTDIRRRFIDLEVTDAPTRAEFTDIKGQLASHVHH